MATTTAGPKLGMLPYMALVFSGVLVFIGDFSLSPSLAAIRANFAHVPNADILTPLLGATAAFTFALGCLMISPVIGRFGYRKVFLLSVILMGLVGPSAGFFDSLYVILLTRVIVGLATAGMVNSALVAISRLLEGPAQSKALGLQSALGAVCGVVLLPIIGALTAMTWRLAFSPGLIALLFIPSILMLPSAGSKVEEARSDTLRNAIRDAGLLLSLTALFGGMVMFAISMFAPLFTVDFGITDPRLLSIAPTAAVAGGAAGAYLSIPLRRRLGVSYGLAVAGATEVAGLLMIAFSSGLWSVAMGSLLGGLGTGLVIPMLYGAALKASPESPASALGLVNALLYGAMILFPLAAMPLAKHVGSRPMLLTLAVAGVVLALAVVATGRARFHEDESEPQTV